MTEAEAIQASPDSGCPPEVLRDLVLLPVSFVGFDGAERTGQIVVHRDVVADVTDVFTLIRKIGFPLAKVIPIAHPAYRWDDFRSCDDNNTSSFNYRVIAGSNKISKHSYGLAIDINPVQNPYIRYDSSGQESFRAPAAAAYDLQAPGTLSSEHPVVLRLKSLGWEWGGDWTKESGRKDYQHFEKSL